MPAKDPELHAEAMAVVDRLLSGEVYVGAIFHPSDIAYVRGVISRALAKQGKRLTSRWEVSDRQKAMFRRYDRASGYSFWAHPKES